MHRSKVKEISLVLIKSWGWRGQPGSDVGRDTLLPDKQLEEQSVWPSIYLGFEGGSDISRSPGR